MVQCSDCSIAHVPVNAAASAKEHYGAAHLYEQQCL